MCLKTASMLHLIRHRCRMSKLVSYLSAMKICLHIFFFLQVRENIIKRAEKTLMQEKPELQKLLYDTWMVDQTVIKSFYRSITITFGHCSNIRAVSHFCDQRPELLDPIVIGCQRILQIANKDSKNCNCREIFSRCTSGQCQQIGTCLEVSSSDDCIVHWYLYEFADILVEGVSGLM